MEQVECWVQLHHCSTSSRNRLLVGRLTIEPVPNSPLGVSPFRFCPPDGPAAVKYLNMPPAIARPSLLRSEIAAGFSHQELASLAHSRRPLARRRPHLHCGVCNILIVVFYDTPSYLRSQLPPSSRPCLCPSYTPTPISPLLYADNRSSPFSRLLRRPVTSVLFYPPIFSRTRALAVP